MPSSITRNTMTSIYRPAAGPVLCASLLLLAACGGGGDAGLPITQPSNNPQVNNGGGDPAKVDTQPKLSEQQRRFESFALESNGGYHDFYWSLPSAGVPSGDDYFVSQQFSIRQSPLTAGPQSIQVAPMANMAHNLGMPAGSDDSRSWMFRSGVIHSLADIQYVIRYQGEDIVRDAYVSTTTSPVFSHRMRVDSVTPLSGALGSTPEELTNMIYNVFDNATTLNRQAQYAQGAAFMKVTIARIGDFHWIGDCRKLDNNASKTPVACATGVTLEAFLRKGFTFSDKSTVTWDDGIVNSIDGYSVWIANTPFTARENPSKIYTIFLEKDGAIYLGSVGRDGGVVNGVEKARNGSTQVEYVPYWSFVNDAARRSIKDAFQQ